MAVGIVSSRLSVVGLASREYFTYAITMDFALTCELFVFYVYISL